MHEEVTDIESDHEENKGEEGDDNDDLEILGARPRGSKRVRVE